MSATVAVFVLFLVVFFQVMRCTKQWLSDGILAEDDAHLLQRPVECALLLSVMALILFAKAPPLGILNAAGLLFLIPVLQAPSKARTPAFASDCLDSDNLLCGCSIRQSFEIVAISEAHRLRLWGGPRFRSLHLSGRPDSQK